MQLDYFPKWHSPRADGDLNLNECTVGHKSFVVDCIVHRASQTRCHLIQSFYPTFALLVLSRPSSGEGSPV